MTKVIQFPAGMKQWAVPLCALGALVLADVSAEAQNRVGEVFQDRFTDGSVQGPEMVVLPSGSFTMGGMDPIFGGGRDGHTVRIGYRLAVGRFEVTFSEWDACVADGGCGGYRPSDEGWGRRNRPVINVGWNDAREYVEWLNRKAGLMGSPYRYRLPSEAEWEYAARAGTSTLYSFGDNADELGEFAWFRDNSDTGSGRRTHPAGTKAPNGFGLHDMHGNASEWVEDCSNDTHAGAPTDGSARTTGNCSLRVLRGGSWDLWAPFLRSGIRLFEVPGDRDSTVGFRVARTLPD